MCFRVHAIEFRRNFLIAHNKNRSHQSKRQFDMKSFHTKSIANNNNNNNRNQLMNVFSSHAAVFSLFFHKLINCFCSLTMQFNRKITFRILTRILNIYRFTENASIECNWNVHNSCFRLDFVFFSRCISLAHWLIINSIAT